MKPTLKPIEAQPGGGLRRVLGVWGAASIVVGTVIGSGIFLVPNTMIKNRKDYA